MSNRKINFRSEDIANLNRIPVIDEKIVNVQSCIQEIKEGVKAISDLKTVVSVNKNDIKWLKGWHNKIVLGVVLSVVVGVITWVFSVVGR